MTARTTRLADGYQRLIAALRRQAGRLGAVLRARAGHGSAEALSDRDARRAVADPAARSETKQEVPHPGFDAEAIRPVDLARMLRRLSGDALVLVIVAALAIVLATTLVIAVPASIDRLSLARRLARAESRLAQLESRFADQQRFGDRFARAFMTPAVYKPAAARTAAFNPDGLAEEGEIVRSMLWQLKSHRGTARFLAGSKVIVLRIDLSGALPKLEWREETSRIPGMLQAMGMRPTERALRAINIQINRFGFAALAGRGVIARDIDGRIRLFRDK